MTSKHIKDLAVFYVAMLLVCVLSTRATQASDVDSHIALIDVASLVERSLPTPSTNETLGAWRWLDDDDAPPLFSHSYHAPFLTTLATQTTPILLQDASAQTLTSFSAYVIERYDYPRLEIEDEREIYRGANISSLAIAPYDKRVFGYLCGGWGWQESQGSDADRSGFSVASWGGGVGKDWDVFGHGLIGFGAQGNETKVKPRSGGLYKESIKTVGGYGRLGIFDALWRVDAIFGLVHNREKQRRTNSSGINRFSTSQWLLDLEFGARFDKGYTRVEPLVNFRVLNLNEPKQAEKFLTTTTRPTDFSATSYRLKLGSRFSWEHDAVLATLKPYLLAAWSHEFGSREIYTISDNAPIPIAFRYGRSRMARDKLDLGGGVDAAMRGSLDLYIKYDVEFAKEYMDYLFLAGFNKKF